MDFKELKKLKPGDSVAILSPSFAAPGKWPHVYELGIKRLKEEFNLDPVEYPTTKKLGASTEERSKDIVSAFSDKDIKGVITSIGGDDQVTYVKNLPKDVFKDNPKPFFGYSDNTQLANHLWLCGVPSYYGGCIFTEYAFQNKIPEFTKRYLNIALFEEGEFEITAAESFNEIGLNWGDESTLNQERSFEENEGLFWDIQKEETATGVLWGGCLESIDEMLRHGIELPSESDFQDIVLVIETSEEMPEHGYVFWVLRALGERGILSKIRGLLVGRPKSWEFGKEKDKKERIDYKKQQRDTVMDTFRKYNDHAVIIQNLDFGHTAPQIPMPLGKTVRIDSKEKRIWAQF